VKLGAANVNGGAAAVATSSSSSPAPSTGPISAAASLVLKDALEGMKMKAATNVRTIATKRATENRFVRLCIRNKTRRC
jgi:hypothetical protein